PVLTLALAHGKNFGAGVDLMAVCKHRVASEDATFRMPGLKFGLVLGTRRLARLVGVQTARQIQQVAKTLNASEAHTVGLVSALAEPQAWPHVIEQQGDIAASLTPSARASLYRVLDENTDAQDMADLVRSVTEPGLKDRIAKYLAAR
ncbi:MAG TPA: enoyl-CoA hydratase/isomerase family protein, partial [Orrella sp.]